MKKILIIGASGMIGNSLLNFFSKKNSYSIYATIRSYNSFKAPPDSGSYQLFANLDVEKKSDLESVFSKVVPDVVINCVGVVKQSKEIMNNYRVISLNSVLPHYLESLCARHGARFINISTDCVFSGSRGNYTEDDLPDATDLYGRTKFLGEVYHGNSITLRTSLIGYEYNNTYGLLEWFLSQNVDVEGYKKAIFSGLTVIEFARIINDHVLPNNNLTGLYQLSAVPICKYDLLMLIKNIYGKNINVIPEDKKVVINRSLDSSSFRKATGFLSKPWPLMIKEMKDYK
ncbi:SDR family oxidoreductase [Candidatus Pelagibacter ubique]|nr:SDR family oxidoreductase [Candidatus Pelagibacter ubique]